MPHPKIKQERYENLGGINYKASTYVTGQREVLDLENYDFQNPGGWNQRWGFTNSINGNTLTFGASHTVTRIFQVYKQAIDFSIPPLADQNRILVCHDSGVNRLQTQGLAGNPSGFTLQYSALITGLTGINWDGVVYKDKAFLTTGRSDVMYKYSPNTFGNVVPTADDIAAFYGMPAPAVGPNLVATTVGTSFSGTYVYAFAGVDALGHIGPLGPTSVINTGARLEIFVSGFDVPNGGSYGLTQYAVFRDRVPGFPSTDLVWIDNTTGPIYVDTFDPLYIRATGAPDQLNNNTSLDTAIGYPLEIYQNRLWLATDIGRLDYSEVEDLQNIQPENNITLVNNIFDITGLKNFNQSLQVLLQKGIFRITGDNPDNFNIQQTSTEYGLISNKAIVSWQERLWFLDEKGIVEYAGANFDIISERVEHLFMRMNIPKAVQRACGIHVRERNEVWFSIPIDGSDINNITIVYDYLVNGFTTFKGDKLKPTALSEVFLDSEFISYLFSKKNVIFTDKKYMFGTIGVSLYYFGESFTRDDGSGTTLSFTTPYHNELGKSRTAQFRRFYLDSGGYAGATRTFGLQFYSNYSTQTIGLTRSLFLSSFQERIDFGIPAKSLSVKVSHGSTQGPFRIDGYTIEYRYQRNV